MGTATTAGSLSHAPEMPSWKSLGSHVGAVITALIFLTAGIWKATHPFEFAQLAEQLHVYRQVSILLAFGLAVTETVAGVLVLIPRYRKWGAGLASLLLIVFMAYVGINYSKLAGQDCSCFPWLKRVVDPMFFVEDGAMLLAALVAGWWTRPGLHLRGPAIVTALVLAFTGTSYGYIFAHRTGTKAPDPITVDGKPFSMAHGRYFVFFFDPECSHCNAAAKTMSKYTWKSDVQIVGVPTRVPQWAPAFMSDNKLKGSISLDLKPLKDAFPFGDPPYGVYIENGRQAGSVSHFEEGNEPADSLRKLGLIE